MLLQEGPADTLSFMILGYAVILGTIALFLVSLVLRFRNLKREMRMLEDLDTK